MSEREREKNEQKKQAKREESEAIQDQMNKLKEEKALHAEARYI